MHRRYCAEDLLRFQGEHAGQLEFVREDVEQHLGVGVGVDVAQVFAEDFLFQLHGVGEITVVRQRQAKGRINVERLRLGRRVATGGGIAHLSDTEIAEQGLHVLRLKHVAHQAVVLAQIYMPAVAGEYAGGILSAVLHHGQPVVDGLIDRAFS